SARAELAEELLDRLARLAGLLLDPADKLVDVAAVDLEVVVGQLTPLLFDLAADLVPLTLQLLRVDGHISELPGFHPAGPEPPTRPITPQPQRQLNRASTFYTSTRGGKKSGTPGDRGCRVAIGSNSPISGVGLHVAGLRLLVGHRLRVGTAR